MKSYSNIDKLEAGVDEAGRGCLFGRVYAAAVILPRNFQEDFCGDIILRDSKKVTKKNRKILRSIIEENAIDFNVSFSEPYEIDQYNIFQATMNTMHKALKNLQIKPDKILVDGNSFRKFKDESGNLVDYECIIKGDDIYECIAAASILAKEYRDEYIERLCEENEELKDKYSLHTNKGYGAKVHMEGIKKYGTVKGHRMSYGPCKKKYIFSKKIG